MEPIRESGALDVIDPATVAEAAGVEAGLDAPIMPTGNQQVPGSAEGEGAVGDTANIADSGQSPAIKQQSEGN